MYSLGGNWNDSSDLAGRCFNGTYVRFAIRVSTVNGIATQCPPGMARAPDLLRDPCPVGQYCPTAATYPIPCPAGMNAVRFVHARGAALCRALYARHRR